MPLPARRPRDRRLWLLGALGVLALLAVGWRAWREATGPIAIPDDPPGFDARDSHLSVEGARAFRALPLLWLGPRHEGMDLRTIQVLGDGTPEGQAAARRRGPIRFTYHDRHDCRMPRGAEFVTCEGRLVSVTTEVMCAPGARSPSPVAREVRLAGLPVAQTARGLEVYSGRVTTVVLLDGVPYIPVLAALRRVEDGRRPAPPAADHPRVRGVTCRDRPR